MFQLFSKLSFHTCILGGAFACHLNIRTILDLIDDLGMNMLSEIYVKHAWINCSCFFYFFFSDLSNKFRRSSILRQNGKTILQETRPINKDNKFTRRVL